MNFAMGYEEFKRLNESLQNSNTACKIVETELNENSKLQNWECRPWNFDTNQNDAVQNSIKNAFKNQALPKNGYGRILQPDINMMFLFSLGDSNKTVMNSKLDGKTIIEVFSYKKKGTINDIEKIKELIDKVNHIGFIELEVFLKICTTESTATSIMKKIEESLG